MATLVLRKRVQVCAKFVEEQCAAATHTQGTHSD
jgi:hypothetical protein